MTLAKETKYLLDFSTKNIIEVSDEIINLLGVSHNEFKQREFDSFIVETSIIKSKDKNLGNYNELVLERVKGNNDIFVAEYLMARADGHYVWVRDTSYITEHNGIAVQCGVLQDISEIIELRKFAGDLHDEYKKLDKLTNLPNKEKLFEQLNYEIERCKRSMAPLSFMLIELSNYFKYKDEFGNEQLNNAVSHIARILKHATRNTDFVGRITESEFGIIMPYTSKQNSIFLIKRLSKLLTRRNIAALSDDFSRDYNFSFGISVAHIGSSNATSMYKSALVDMQMSDKNIIGSDEQNILNFLHSNDNFTVH